MKILKKRFKRDREVNLKAVKAGEIENKKTEATKFGSSLRKLPAPIVSPFEYSIKDFLENVKGIYDDTFSEDVYKTMQVARRKTDFSDNLLFSSRGMRGVFAEEREAVEEAAREGEEALKKEMDDMRELIELQREAKAKKPTKNAVSVLADVPRRQKATRQSLKACSTSSTRLFPPQLLKV